MPLMNINLISQKLYNYTVGFLILLIAFVIGTFFPSDYIKEELRRKTINEIKSIGIFEPKIINQSNLDFINSTTKCINYLNLDLDKDEQIPTILILAQAVVESNYGTSRLALEAQNLFGIRIWSKEGVLPYRVHPDSNWRIRVFKSKCQSVKYYINLLNTSHHYTEFRKIRQYNKDPVILAKTLNKFSSSQDYTNEIIRNINHLRLRYGK